jgi:hypothetical protein
MNHLIIALVYMACAVSGFCATPMPRDLAEFFGGREGCFVLYVKSLQI